MKRSINHPVKRGASITQRWGVDGVEPDSYEIVITRNRSATPA